jgi:hypothetical protein
MPARLLRVDAGACLVGRRGAVGRTLDKWGSSTDSPAEVRQSIRSLPIFELRSALSE